MLRKKYIVQKSFRIDYQLSDDLEYLSYVLDRPQNDLVNIAIEALIFDNRQWFVGEILVNQCHPFFEEDKDVELTIDNLHILLQTMPEDKYVCITYSVYKDGKYIFDDDIEIFYKDKQEVKDALKKWINVDGATMSKLIIERLNYK